MALTDENGGGVPVTMLVSPSGGLSGQPYPVYMGQNSGNSGNNGFGNDNGFWIILLFLLLIAGGGWNNNGGGNGGFGGGQPVIINDGNGGAVQRGFDQAAIIGGINGVQNAVNGLGTQLCNGFSQAEIAANARQVADMNQAFAMQTAMSQGFNQLGAQFSDCLNTVGSCAA